MNRLTSKIVQRRFFVAAGHAFRLTSPVLLMILAFEVALGLLIGFLEGWSFGDAVYFTFITGLTIGYGDIVPRFVDEPLANRCFDTIESLDHAVGQRCLALTHQWDTIRDSTLFHWWPRQPPRT